MAASLGLSRPIRYLLPPQPKGLKSVEVPPRPLLTGSVYGTTAPGAILAITGLIPRSITADRDGGFVIEDVPPGDYQLAITSPRSERLTLEVAVGTARLELGHNSFMAQAVSLPLPRAEARESAVPWYVWCAVLANTSSMIGVHWDISWHRSIGRDTFWTPAHMAIYLCGVLAGLSSAYTILGATFSTTAVHLRQEGVRMWGFRGPLGAFIMAWGGVAMLTSAPFDDWWHSAYGLDVRIISPPHTLLAMGIFSIQLGAIMLILGRMNRAAEGEGARLLRWLYIYMGGLAVVNMATFIIEYAFRVNMHSAVYYRSIGLAIPFFLFAVSGSAGVRWATTKVAAVYMIFWQAMNLVLPLFPAEPKLGPIYHQVTHFVPSTFPFLLVIPAFAVDLLLQRTARIKAWLAGAGAGFVFMLLLLGCQWPLGYFLLSPRSRNWFFYTDMHDYRTGPNSYSQLHQFFPWEKTMPEFWTNLALAFAASMIMSALGLMLSRWLSRVKR